MSVAMQRIQPDAQHRQHAGKSQLQSAFPSPVREQYYTGDSDQQDSFIAGGRHQHSIKQELSW
jgi:hypothetical protein